MLERAVWFICFHVMTRTLTCSISPVTFVLCFFFQAEDGIRYLIVTGVQTCAFFFSSRRRHTRSDRDWSSDVCSSDLGRRSGASRVARGAAGADRGGRGSRAAAHGPLSDAPGRRGRRGGGRGGGLGPVAHSTSECDPRGPADAPHGRSRVIRSARGGAARARGTRAVLVGGGVP